MLAPMNKSIDLGGLVPTITTARLLLRGFREEDFDAYAAHLADREARPPPLEPVDRRTAWRMFAAGIGCWALTRAGAWAVTLRSTGEVVGTVGVFYREAPSGAPRSDLEQGWFIYRQHWRNGYASEAAAAALAYGFETIGASRVIAHIDEANFASIAVSQRIGMRYERDVDFYEGKARRYAIAKPSPGL